MVIFDPLITFLYQFAKFEPKGLKIKKASMVMVIHMRDRFC